MKCLAIDIGASSGRGIVGVFAEDGSGLETREVHRFENGYVEKAGRKVWDLGALMRGVTESIRAAAADAAGGPLLSVGIDTWGVDYGYVGPGGELLGEVFSYRDSRTDDAVPWVHERIPQAELYSIAGTQHMAINTVFQVADDVMRAPELVESAEHMLMMPDLLAFMLTGEAAAEYTIASTSEMLDAVSRDWSDGICSRIGFPRRLLPKVVMPGESWAPVRPELARELGAPEDLRLIRVGSHDTASAVAAVPVTGAAENWIYISSGTWSLVGMELDAPVLTDAALEANFTNEGGVGGSIRFLRNVSGLWIIQELRRLWREKDGSDHDWPYIVQCADAAPPHAAFINPDAEIFVSPDDMRHALYQNCSDAGFAPPDGIGPTARCVFESLAFAYRRAVEGLARVTGRGVEHIHVVGGGSQNDLLCRLTAEACGVTVHAGPAEATALGNLVVQAVALGGLPDVAAGRELVARTEEPRVYLPEGGEEVEEAYARFLEVE